MTETLTYHLHPTEFGHFEVWDEPLENRTYVLGMDTAEGKERDIGGLKASARARRRGKRDYTAGIVIEAHTGQHVATWHGTIPATDWGYVGAAIGIYYNTALIVPEVNGPGLEVTNTLSRRINYPNLYVNKLFGNIEGDDISGKWGFRTNQQTRPLLISRVEEQLNARRLFTRDQKLVKELRTMEIDDTGKARAKHPNHDDLVLALALALQGRDELLQNVQGPGAGRDDDLADLPARDRRIWERKREADERARDRAAGDGLGGDGSSWNPFRGRAH